MNSQHPKGFVCKYCPKGRESILLSKKHLEKHIRRWHYESVSREQRIAWDKEEFGPNVSSDS